MQFIDIENIVPMFFDILYTYIDAMKNNEKYLSHIVYFFKYHLSLNGVIREDIEELLGEKHNEVCGKVYELVNYLQSNNLIDRIANINPTQLGTMIYNNRAFLKEILIEKLDDMNSLNDNYIGIDAIRNLVLQHCEQMNSKSKIYMVVYNLCEAIAPALRDN